MIEHEPSALVPADQEFMFWATVRAIVTTAGFRYIGGAVYERGQGPLVEMDDAAVETDLTWSWRLNVQHKDPLTGMRGRRNVYGTNAAQILANLRAAYGSSEEAVRREATKLLEAANREGKA